MVNKVILIGNLGKTPEIYNTNAGRKIAKLSVATTEKWKDGNGEKQEKTEWHTVAVYNNALAGFCEKYLKKGDKVYIEGTLRNRKYTDKSNQTKYATEVSVENYTGTIQSLTAQKQEAIQTESAQEQAEGFDDEIPF